MANLGRKNGVYLARFRFLGAEYKKSLKTRDRKAADAAMHRVEEVLHRLAIRLIVTVQRFLAFVHYKIGTDFKRYS